MIDALRNFVYKYYIEPILLESGYNIVNTLTYGVLLVLIGFCLYKILERLNVKFDKKFFIALLPFIGLGSVLRVLKDADIFQSPIFVSPLIYFFVFFLTFPTLLFSLFVEKKFKIPYNVFMFSIGIFFLLFFGKFVAVNTWIPFIYVSVFTVFWSLTIFSVKKIFNLDFLNTINSGLILAHLFDASTTFIAITFFGYGEQHVLARFLMNFLGPVAMFIIKIVIIPFVLWSLDEIVDNERQNRFLKLIVFIVGFAPGCRNLIRTMMGV